MNRQRRRVLVRVLGTVGVVTQFLVGLMGIIIFPAAFVSFFGGIAGIRLVGRDLEAASMRLGVALLASLVGLLFGMVAALPMAVAAAVSSGCFGGAWWLVQQLGSEDRAAFGIKHRDWEHRNTAAHVRREELRNRLPGTAPGAGSTGDDDATGEPAADDVAWWEELD